jgi:hypothetical protein
MSVPFIWYISYHEIWHRFAPRLNTAVTQMIKDHPQCLSHHKIVHLGFTTVNVKEQKTLLQRHAILLAFSECVMK